MVISAGSGVPVDSGVENGDTSVQVCSTCMAVLKITFMHVVDWPHTRFSPSYLLPRVLYLVSLKFSRLQMKFISYLHIRSAMR